MALKVLIVSDVPHPKAVNGVSIYLSGLIEHFGGSDIEFALFCHDKGRGRMRLDVRNDSNIPTYTLINSKIPYRNAVADPLPGCTDSKTEAAFKKTLTEFKPQIVHFHEFIRNPASCIMIAREFGSKVVVTLHDFWLICPNLLLFTPDEHVCSGPDGGLNCVIHCLGGTSITRIYRSILSHHSPWLYPVRCIRDIIKKLRGESLGQRPGKLFLKHYGNLLHQKYIKRLYIRENFMIRALNSAHLILPVSQRVGEIYTQQGVKPELIQPLNLGIPAANNMIYRIRKPKYPVRFGFLGHLGPCKGSHIIVAAAKNIDSTKARFLFYGSGDDYAKAEFNNLTHKTPHIRYMGRFDKNELQTILDELDILIFPSLWEETLGLVALEALASGVPVIASRIGGITDYLKHDINGLFFSAGDVEGLKEKILSLVENPDRIVTLSKRTRESILPMKTHTETLISLYKKLSDEQ